MAQKRKKIYHALVEGAAKGLSDKQLYDYVLKKCPKSSSKKIVRAALLALTDPDVTDRRVLDSIYALAIKHRMDELGQADEADEHDDEPHVPSVKPPRRSLKADPTRAGTTRH